MILQGLLEILCCPETHQPLELAPKELIVQLNGRIQARQIKNRAGQIVEQPLDGGLLRADKKVLYPVRRIPILLIDEGIVLE